MEKEEIKNAFFRVKDDITYLEQEIYSLKNELSEVKSLIMTLSFKFDSLTKDKTVQQINSTNTINSTDNSTVPQEIEGLKYQDLSSSTGNRGVPTNRQTHSQTNQHSSLMSKKTDFGYLNYQQTDFTKPALEENIKQASEILDSLDKIKREIRSKFKHLTPQEMAVFSTIYQLEEQDPDKVVYKTVADSLKLSESSIRDYVQRMLNKGIPIKKHKINNKIVLLSVSEDLKKIATLSTIIKLREV